MRNFYVRKGQFQGTYIIYDSVEEFQKEMPGIPYIRYIDCVTDQKIEAGQWVEALDGYITQCLRVVEKRNLIFYRFPMVTTRHAFANGRHYWTKLYAQYAVQDPYSLSGKHPGNRESVLLPKYEAYGHLLATGMNYMEAYKQVDWGPGSTNLVIGSYMTKVLKALSHPVVMEILKKKNESLIVKIKEDPDFAQEKIKELIKEFMENVKPGSQTQLNFIALLITLMEGENV